MLIPQFSIRWLLGVTAVCAVIFSIFGLAVRGHQWAVGASIGVVSLVVVMFVYAAIFCLVWTFSLLVTLTRSGPSGAGRSPFRAQGFVVAAPVSDKDVPALPVILDDGPAGPE